MEAPRHGERMEDSGQTSRALSTLFPRSRYVSERGRSGPKWPDVATRAGARLWTAGPLAGSPLLDLGLAAGFGEFLGDRLGVGLGNAFLHRLGRGIDPILGFLEPQSGHSAAGAATATAAAAADTPNFSSMSLMSCDSSRTVMVAIASRISAFATVISYLLNQCAYSVWKWPELRLRLAGRGLPPARVRSARTLRLACVRTARLAPASFQAAGR